MKKEKLKKKITSLAAWMLLMSIVMSGGVWTVLLFIMVACTVFWGFPQGESMWFAALTLPLVIWFWITMLDDHSISNFKKKVFPKDYEG
jgi:hypothetical protein